MKTLRIFMKVIISVSVMAALVFPAASEETFEPNTYEIHPSDSFIRPYQPPEVHYDYPEADTGLIDYLYEQFGEPNNTREEAYILDTDPPWLNTYEAALSGDEDSVDTDYYQIYSPAYGTPHFSGWLKITVRSGSDEDLKISMWTPGDTWTPQIFKTASDSSRGYWVGLARDASVTIAVELRFESAQAQPVHYQIEVASGIIDDANEPDDEDPDVEGMNSSGRTSCDCAADPQCLCHGAVRSSYIAPVFDASGNVVGRPDKYYFYHNSCRNEAAHVSRRVNMGYNDSIGGVIFDYSKPTPWHYEDGWFDLVNHTGETLEPEWMFLTINNPDLSVGNGETLCAGQDDGVVDDNNHDGIPDYYQIPYELTFIDRGDCCAGDCAFGNCTCDTIVNGEDENTCNCTSKSKR